MEFCSKYGYNYGFEGSDSEDYSDDDEKTEEKVKKKIRKADTNIISVKFDHLVAANEMFAGEPKSCKKCGAIMSVLSKDNTIKENDKLIWTCEFCSEKNDMTNIIDDLNEIPKKDDVTFMLELPKKNENEDRAAAASIKEVSGDNSYLAFCIDISGSMNTNIPVTDQPSAKYRNMTRLNGVKAACMETLKKLKDEEPNKRVALVTFTNDVQYYGDCTKLKGAPIITIKDELKNKEQIEALAQNADEDLKCVSESYNNIDLKLKSLRAHNYTALGPALLFAVSFASKKPGSSIILCTDGCANVGLGNVEKPENEESERFYDDIADYAKEKGVVVNVFSMEGTDCKLALLGRVADRSNGTMNIVNPLNLSDEFASILQNRIVGTNVVAKLIVNHKYLYIRDESLEAEEGKAIDADDEAAKAALELKKESTVVRNIGNANIDTEITFEYGIRKLNDKNEKKENLKEMPFQLQITYTGQDGSKAVRVYTKILKFTTDRVQAERNIISNGIFFTHSGQTISHQLLSNNMTASKYRTNATTSLLTRNMINVPARFQNFTTSIKSYSKTLNSNSLRDDEAEEVYHHSTVSRRKMVKRNEDN